MSFAGTEQLPALPAPSRQDPGLCPQRSVPEVGSQRSPPPSTVPMAPSDPHGYLMAIRQWHHPPPSSLPEVTPPVSRCRPLCLDFPTLLLSPCPVWGDGAKRCSCSVGSRDRGRTSAHGDRCVAGHYPLLSRWRTVWSVPRQPRHHGSTIPSTHPGRVEPPRRCFALARPLLQPDIPVTPPAARGGAWGN